jgi:hypothetical protein
MYLSTWVNLTPCLTFSNVLFLFRRSKLLSHRSKLIMTSFGLNFMSLWQIFQPVSMAHFGQKFRRVLTKQMTTFGQKLWRNFGEFSWRDELTNWTVLQSLSSRLVSRLGSARAPHDDGVSPHLKPASRISSLGSARRRSSLGSSRLALPLGSRQRPATS